MFARDNVIKLGDELHCLKQDRRRYSAGGSWTYKDNPTHSVARLTLFLILFCSGEVPFEGTPGTCPVVYSVARNESQLTCRIEFSSNSSTTTNWAHYGSGFILILPESRINTTRK